MPPQIRERECRTCKAPIKLVRRKDSDRWLVLDAEPDAEKGNTLILAGEGQVLGARDPDLDRLRSEGIPLYLSHFATCPEAKQHRRP